MCMEPMSRAARALPCLTVVIAAGGFSIFRCCIIYVSTWRKSFLQFSLAAAGECQQLRSAPNSTMILPERRMVELRRVSGAVHPACVVCIEINGKLGPTGYYQLIMCLVSPSFASADTRSSSADKDAFVLRDNSWKSSCVNGIKHVGVTCATIIAFAA